MSILWFLFPILLVRLDIQPVTHGLILGTGRAVVMATYCLMYWFPFWQYRFPVAVISQVIGALGLVIIGLAQSTPSLGLGAASGSFFGGLAAVDMGSRAPFFLAGGL